MYSGGPRTGEQVFDESGSASPFRTVNYSYGKEGELLSRTGSCKPVAYTYDATYRLKTLTDGDNDATIYAYNAQGYLASVAYPGGGGDAVQFSSYNNAGQMLQRVDGNNVVTNYAYDMTVDGAGALTDVLYPAIPGRNAHFTYDAYGRRATKSDVTGTESYAHGDVDELLSVTTAYVGLPAQTISYGYYPDGSRSMMSTPAGSFSYTYDSAGRPQSLTNPYSETTSWQWLDNGWLWTQALANGAVTTYTYDALGRVIGLLNTLGSGSGAATLSQFAVQSSGGYDGAGNLLSVTANLTTAPSSFGGLTTYQYDAKDQLLQEQSARGGGYTNAFGYDEAGNPTTFKGAGRSYNAKNQLIGSGIGYDNNGNPVSYGGAALTFDPENKLTAFGSALTAGYTIDGLRAWKQDGTGNRTYYLWDLNDSCGIPRPVVELTSTGTIATVNTFGASGLISRNASGVPSGSVFYTFDPSGSTAQRLSNSGAVLSSHFADAFGTTATTLSGTSADPFDGFGAKYGYYTDHETGLILCTYRYLDSNAGRWLTRDPIGYEGGINLYGYCMNNPIMGGDPSGCMYTRDEEICLDGWLERLNKCEQYRGVKYWACRERAQMWYFRCLNEVRGHQEFCPIPVPSFSPSLSPGWQVIPIVVICVLLPEMCGVLAPVLI